MRAAVFAVVVVALLGLSAVAAGPLAESESKFLFAQFSKQHGKKYSHDEVSHRYTVFKDNLNRIIQHNKSNSTFTMAMNQFGDLTPSEFAAYKGYTPRVRSVARAMNSAPLKADSDALPSSIDWRSKGAVAPVQNQGQCGSCWSFSAVGAIEGAWQIAGNSLTKLSEQQLVDCSGSAGNQGCNGGLMDYAFEWVIQNKGICSEADYGYTAKDGTCKKTCKTVAHISSYKDVPTNSESSLQTAVAQQPVAVAIEADTMVFQFYSSGVLDSASCGTNLDHGVLAVGYGTDAGKDYWIVKNSWGTSWGEQGYVRMARNKNTCGIAIEPSYPIV